MTKIIIECQRPTFSELSVGTYFACEGVVYYKITCSCAVCIAKISDNISKNEITGKYVFDDNKPVKVIKCINFS